ncbi:MAG: GC-type dockerin domain-anchored protein [Phycisphaerales bacterium]
MRTALAAFASLAFCAAAFGQWPTSSSTPLAIGDGEGEQNQSLLAVAPDGSTYVMWHDNRPPGGYNPTIQRLNAAGVEQWAHNGLTLADTTYTATLTYIALSVDSSGNAIAAYGDNSSGTFQVAVQKISPAGVKLWGPNGVAIPNSASATGVKVTSVANGDVVVGFTANGGHIQRIGPNGELVGAMLDVVETGHVVFVSELRGSTNGAFVALFTRSFGTNYQTTAKYLYVQKYDVNNVPQWPTDAGAIGSLLYGPTGAPYTAQGGSIQSGTFPTFVSDGAGGAVFSWYETGGYRKNFVQHVRPNGALRYPAPGLPASPRYFTGPGTLPAAATIGLDISADYLPVTDEIVATWRETNNGAQSNDTVYAQKFGGGDGNAETLLWGADGVVVRPTLVSSGTSHTQPSIITTRAALGGCYSVWIVGLSNSDSLVQGQRIKSGGDAAWNNGEPLTISSEGGYRTNRMGAGVLSSGSLVVSYSNSPDISSSNADLYIQHVTRDGEFTGDSCTAADVAGLGGSVGPDGALTADDLIVYLDAFFSNNLAVADIASLGGGAGADGQLTADDLIYFLGQFFTGCN